MTRAEPTVRSALTHRIVDPSLANNMFLRNFFSHTPARTGQTCCHLDSIYDGVPDNTIFSQQSGDCRQPRKTHQHAFADTLQLPYIDARTGPDAAQIS